MERWMSVMVVAVLVLGLVGTAVQGTTSTPKPGAGPVLPNGRYMILCPKSMRVGQSFSVTIQVFDLVKDFVVSASLSNPRDDIPLVTGDVLFKKGTHSGTIEMKVPAVDLSFLMFKLTGVSKEDDGHPVRDKLSFKEEKSIQLEKKAVSVYIQTDKAMYKPSQTVHFRAMAVYPDMKPYLGALDIDIIDADENKIRQYKNVTNPGHNGVITKELQLSDQPILGDWKIKVRALGILQIKTLTVAEYVLPKFKVTIDAPSFFFYRNNVLHLNIGAKYTYGKKVKGVAEVVIQLKYRSYQLNGRKPPQHKIIVQDFDGSTTVKMTQEQLLELVVPPVRWHGVYDPFNTFKYKTIVVSANVTEGVSGITLSDSVDIPVKIQRYELKFLAATPSSFKPGLTYVGFVKLSQMDGSPPLPSDLHLTNGFPRKMQMVFTGTVSGYKQERLNDSFLIQPSGLVRFSVRVPKNFEALSITATFKFVSKLKSGIKKFKSMNDVGIQVSLIGLEDGRPVKPNIPTSFFVKSTEEIKSFNIVIFSKGMLIISEHVQRAKASRSNMFIPTFNSSIAQKLSPSAHVVVWYMSENNEVITDSLNFNVEGAFANEVSLSFDKNITRPGDSLKLKVTADPASYVGLLAVDQSVLLLKGGNDITQKDVIDELKTFGSGKISSPDVMPDFMRCMFCGWPVFSGGTDSKEVFDTAGVYVITNALVYKYIPEWTTYPPTTMIPVTTTMMTMNMPTMTMPTTPGIKPDRTDSERPLVKPTVTRSLFPETWLWSDAIIGENGETKLEVKVPDTITSWVATAFAMHSESGLGVSPSASKLTVFQPFFVTLNLPYSIIRGEEFGLQAMVFNYLPITVEVKVTLHKSDSFRVRSVNDLTNAISKDIVVWITVPPNEAQSAWFWIVPHRLGNIPIEVKGQSQYAADAVRRVLLVEPEGTPQEYTKSVILDFSSSSSSLSETVDITFPPDLVKGSEYIKVTAIGDLMGTSIQGLGALLRMPYGCGEQNMINFAPAIFIMDYLVATNQVTPEVKAKAIKVMESGYMRELSYQHRDGSFSAFGDSDTSGSMWLTAFVAKSFHQAKYYIYIETALIEKTLNWMIKKQKQDGSFAEPVGGRVIHKAMQGGSSKGLPLTAYVLIALVENKDITGWLETRLNNAIASALAHLEGKLDDIEPYALAIVTYALAVSKSSKAAEALQKLNALAINAGGMKHWEVGTASESDPSLPVWRRPYHQAQASNIEMTSYALLVYTAEHKVVGGIPILKWLATQRNSNGGFSSTQDTVLALQAMAELSAMTFGGASLNLDISLKAGGIDYKYDKITKSTAGILQSKQLPGHTDEVVIMANGTGIGIVQVAVSYNVDSADNRPGVIVDIETTDKGNGTVKIKVCGKYTKKDESGMTVLEVGLISGSRADTSQLISQVPTLKRIETKDRKVVLYFDEFEETKTCVEFESHQDMPVTKPKKARVEGYLYYNPDMKDTKYYLPPALEKTDICSVCPKCCELDNITRVDFNSTSFDINADLFNGATRVMNYTVALCLAAIVGHLLVI